MLFTLVLSALAAIVASIHRDGFTQTHGYHVHKFKAIPTSDIPHGVENAMSGTMDLEIQADEFIFHLDLVLKTRQWADDAKIVTEVDAKGNPTKTEPLFHRGYYGSAVVMHSMIQESGKASVTFYDDGRASVAVVTDQDVYDLDIIERADGSLNLKGHNRNQRMYMTRVSDIPTSEKVNDKLAVFKQYLHRRPGARHLNQLIPFTGCFNQQANMQRAVRIGMLADSAFQSKTGGASAARSAMIADLNRASDLIYEPQLRVWLLIGTVWTGGVPAAAVSSCGVDGSSRLTKFRNWRRTLGKDRHALIHLFTNCHPPPGTVGLAYVNVLCSVQYGTGWTNFMNNGGTWKVLAHELGHNFGSPHSFDNGQGRTGGIMDYGDGKYPAPGRAPAAQRKYAFNPLRKNDVCGGISKSLSGTNSWLIPPNQCWTTFGGTTPSPRPTPRPTTRPAPVTQPTRRPPTPRPTVRPPTSTSCTGLTMTASWWIRRNNANCYWYMRALRKFKPCIPQVTYCRYETRSGYPTWRLVTMKFITSRAVYSAYNYNTWRTGIENALRQLGLTFYRRRQLGANPAPPQNNVNVTNGMPRIDFQWVRNPNTSVTTPCTPTCGTYRYRLESWVCQQNATDTTTGGTTVYIVPDSNCGLDLKPIVPIACTANACQHTCGNSKLEPTEKCDVGNTNCCAPGCQGFKTTATCLTQNTEIDATFMSCLNDVAKTNCYLYVFQGEYFMKYYAVPGRTMFYQTEWANGAIKHMGTFQPNWATLTAVAGGRNGQVWAFNNLDFMKIDYSNENTGKVLASGNVGTTWGAPAAFVQCGKVTAAEVIAERYIMLFCNNIYIHIYIPTETANTTVFPADSLFTGGTIDVGVNAFYFDVRDSTYRIIRRDVQDMFRQPGLSSIGTGTMATIFGTGTTPTISNSQCAVRDPECVSCQGVNQCTKCNPNYKVLVSRCVPESTLVDMQFSQNSQNDKFYSSDPALATAQFTPGHGGTAASAMVFTPTTRVMARAPTLVGRTIKDFRIEVFYKPTSVSMRQSLVTIDSRFELDLQQHDAQTFRLFVRFDTLTFDCYVPKPLTVGKWNLVAVEFANRQIITSVNGFEHNRGFTVTAGAPPALGLTFQNVTIGGQVDGLNGALDSLLIKEVPAAGTTAPNNSGNKSQDEAWVMPVIIVAVVLGVCLIAGISFLAYTRGLCGGKKDTNDDVNTAFLSAAGQNTGGNYIQM